MVFKFSGWNTTTASWCYITLHKATIDNIQNPVTAKNRVCKACFCTSRLAWKYSRPEHITPCHPRAMSKNKIQTHFIYIYTQSYNKVALRMPSCADCTRIKWHKIIVVVPGVEWCTEIEKGWGWFLFLLFTWWIFKNKFCRKDPVQSTLTIILSELCQHLQLIISHICVCKYCMQNGFILQTPNVQSILNANI